MFMSLARNVRESNRDGEHSLLFQERHHMETDKNMDFSS